jgi:glycosyltransferase involved in cell wall biosynthesis
MSGIKVLHVVTLGGPNGEYGGPLRVAREFCGEHSRRGGSAVLLFGIDSEVAPTSTGKFPEIAISVAPLSKKYKVSSLISVKFISQLIIQIRRTELVHIHFGRDIISILASILSMLLDKPIVLQTHGMVVPDSRRFARILDFLIVRPIMQLADKKLALSFEEVEKLSELGIDKDIVIQPNGIGIPTIGFNASGTENPRIIFCGRLFRTKGIDLFLEIVKRCHSENLQVSFEIYGPDGGELPKVIRFIESNDLSSFLKYLGPIQPHLVQETLAKADIVVLPSNYDPYPMVVLEALSVGTRVVISNVCGQAEIVKKIDPRFVPLELSSESFYLSLKSILAEPSNPSDRLRIIEFCRDNFGIVELYGQIEQVYSELTGGNL